MPRMVSKKRLIICLYGDENSGKTTTLLDAGTILRQKSKQYTEIKHKATSVDRRMVFNVFGTEIGIGTYGDDWASIDGNFKILIGYGCTIIITASRNPIDRRKKYKRCPNLKRFIRSAAVWNLPKSWIEKRGGKDVANVTCVGSVLHYVIEATNTVVYVDRDIY